MEIVPVWVRRIWSADEIRFLILFSLVIQIFLIFLGVRRKYSASRSLSLVLWSFYLLADYVATLALGNLLNTLNDDNNSGTGSLLAFWSPFLLLHLGGPDTITAYSIEDNELWWRHFLGLVFQVLAAVLVFLLSLPSTQLWKAAIPVYFAGILKYGERTWSLRSASMGCFMDSLIPPADPGPSYAKFMEEYASQSQAGLGAEIQMEREPQLRLLAVSNSYPSKISDALIMSKAYHFFGTFKRLVVDLILTFHDRADSQSFFLQRFPEQAFKVIEIELSFVFDTLYTKAALVHNFKGYMVRCSSLGMIILSLVLFCHAPKGDFKEVDVIITYILLAVALGLETISIVLLIFSDWAFIWLDGLSNHNSLAKQIFHIVCHFQFPIGYRWSNHISQHNLISFCLRDQPSVFRKTLSHLNAKETWDNLLYTNRVEVSDVLKRLIFYDLKEKAESVEEATGYKRFNTCRGELALQQKGFRKILGWSIDDVEFDESILLWHIATDLCYCTDNNETNKDNKEMSRAISNYMLYLLVQRPFMLTAGIGKIRFGDTCAEAKNFFEQEFFTIDKEEAKKLSKQEKENEEQAWACKLLLEVETEVPPIQVKGDRSKSVLFDACRLAKNLQYSMTAEKRWRVVSAVWVEMLCFAASHCRGNVHAKQLSSGGGELLTHVWFLIAHLGMGEHYRVEAGHARAKLILEK